MARVCEAAGMLGSLMGCSFEQLVVDNDMLGMVLRTVRGIGYRFQGAR